MMTFAKGMANGFPIGATLATPEIAEAVQGLTFATFGGNPLTMTAALATIEYIEKYDLPKNAAERGAELRARLVQFQQEYDFIGDVRGMGLMQALEIVVPNTDKTPACPSHRPTFERRSSSRIADRQGWVIRQYRSDRSASECHPTGHHPLVATCSKRL
jgi:4-aminobutyrate aminotransferase-like enzyme